MVCLRTPVHPPKLTQHLHGTLLYKHLHENDNLQNTMYVIEHFNLQPKNKGGKN